MSVSETLQCIIFTALQLGDHDTALLWLETLCGDQLVHYACQYGRVDLRSSTSHH